MPITKKDYILSAIAGFITVLFLYPVFTNISLKIPYYKVFFIIAPILWMLGIYIVFLFRREWMRQFGKFAVVGVLNTAIDFGILNFMSMRFHAYSGLKILETNPISFIIAVTNSFFWNKYWVFGEKKRPDILEVVKFLLITSIGSLINTSIVFLITKNFTFGNFSEGQILNLAKIFATAITLLWNFTGLRIFVFKTEDAKLSAPRV